MKRLILIDSHALIHRAYHALPPLVSPSGELVNGVYGFLLAFLKIIEELKPDYVIATFDLPTPTVRHEIFKDYKAKRVKAPENFYKQIEILKEILKTWGVMCLEKKGYEADDLIGTVVEKYKNLKDLEIIILTGDLDTLQLVSENVKVYTFKRGIQDKIIYDIDKIKERFDLEPEQLRDYKALKGDPSDNILGVPKIGEKLAKKLIKEFQSLDGIYKAIEENKKINLSPSILENLKKYKDQAYFSQQLVTIIKDVPLDLDINKALYKEPPLTLLPLFKKLGFNSLIKRISSFSEGLFEQSYQVAQKEIKKEEKDLFLQKISQAQSVGLKLDYLGDSYKNLNVKGIFFLLDEKPFSKKEKIIYYLKKDLLDDFLKEFLNSIKNFPKEIFLVERKIFLERFPLFKNFEPFFWDLDILSWLIDSERKNYSLKELVRFFLKKNPSNDLQAFSDIFELSKQLKLKIESLALNTLYQEIEKPLVKVLAEMEETGIFLNKEKLARTTELVKEKKRKIEEKIYQIAGIVFNINSPRQLQEILFERLKIPLTGLKRTKTGKISTDWENLERLKSTHLIIDLIINYRQLEKLLNTFLEPLPTFISEKTLRIHPVWEQCGTSTGRLSCRLPNLQNLPQKGNFAFETRVAFEAQEDNVFLSLDYSQIELRLVAHLSSDPFLVSAFQENKDIHKMTASYLFNIKEEEVTEKMRNIAKRLNYGILYGLGDKNLANYTSMTLEEAKKFKEEYFKRFFGVKNYLDYSLDRAKNLGYAETLFGRKRFLPLLGAYNLQGKVQERAAINMPIQGLAADLIKKTMIEIDRFLEENNLKKNIKMIIQIHDELIFEGKLEIINKVKSQLINIAENIYPLQVPLKVEAKIGKNLAEI